MAEPPLVPAGLRSVVVGHGIAGQLHRSLLGDWGVEVSIVEPRGVPDVESYARVADIPAALAVDIWSVCTPTDQHLATVRTILARCPDAWMIVEKPLCGPAELEEFIHLLREHPDARLVLMDHYQYAVAPGLLTRLCRRSVGETAPTAVRVAFSKDRRDDVAAGRFVDRSYGVFGYEWLHMIALLRGALPAEQFLEYVASPIDKNALSLATGAEAMPPAARERARLTTGCEIDLYSTVVGPADEAGLPAPEWTRQFPTGEGGRQRLLRIEAGAAALTAELDPVTDRTGRWLGRNVHRLSLEQAGYRQEWIVRDSPMSTALATAVATLSTGCSGFDAAPMRRLRSLASTARSAAYLREPAGVRP